MSENFYSELRARFPRDLRTIAIETVTGQYYRYSDIDSQSARLANALTVLGVRPGERVAVQVEKSPEALLLYLACLRAGGVYLPLNTGYTQTELAYFLNDAEPAVLVCSPEQQAALAPLAQRYGVAHVMTLGTEQDGNLLELAAQQSAEFTDAACSRDDLAAILYTSGTTGRSKGAMLTHGNLAFSACVLCQVWAFNERDVLLHALPLFHVHGLFVATHCTLMSASRMIFFPRFDLDALLAALPRATVLMGVPTFYTRLLGRSDFTRERCRGMRLFISGSAPLSAETHREFRERTGYAILERYGMTETNMLTSNPYYGERIAGSVGLPLPGVEVRIADLETGAVLPAGAIGVIKVRGPNVFKGYWRMPEKTAQEFRADGFFITGDLGCIDEHGYVTIVGRAKDLIISGGYNVYPKEIEALLEEIGGIIDAAVVGLPHRDLGEAVTAVVIVRPGHSLDEASIQAYLKEHLAPYKVPKRVLLVEELPRNTMGKVQKNALRERYRGLYADS